MAVESMTQILIVEDDPKYRRLVAINLRAKGYRVDESAEGREALARLYHHEPDLIVMDLKLPDIDGIALCAQIREVSTAPLLVLTAVDSEEVLVRALDAGADDYMLKPFSLVELLARIRALLRRNHVLAEVGSEITCGDFRLSYTTRSVVVRGQSCRLTPTEWRLMREFMTHCGEVLTHEYLLRRVWGLKYLEEHEYLRVYVRRLRGHLETDAKHPVHLISYVGVGYAFHAYLHVEQN